MKVSEILKLLELLDSLVPGPKKNTMAPISVGAIAAITAAISVMNAQMQRESQATNPPPTNPKL